MEPFTLQQQTAPEPKPEETTRRIRAVVGRVFYCKDNYSVFRCAITTRQGKKFEMTAAGPATVTQGASVILEGKVIQHPKYGEQFKASLILHDVPTDQEGMLAYLESGMIKGVGKKYARLIVDAFGDDTLKVIEHQPERLQEVEQIGPKRAAKIAAALKEQKSYMGLLTYLKRFKIGNAMALKIQKQYGTSAVAILERNPYQISEISGIGFRMADDLAEKMGAAKDSVSRIRAGIRHVLAEECQRQGHTWIEKNNLIIRTHQLLNHADEKGYIETECVAREQIQAVMETDEELKEQIEPEEANGEIRYAPLMLKRCEEGIVRNLVRVMSAASPFVIDDLEIRDVRLNPTGPDGEPKPLSESQREAVFGVLSNKVSIMTGGPGTGKTTTLNQILGILQDNAEIIREKLGNSLRISLTAPTGRAAKRASEATGYPAGTVHRTLGYGRGEGRGWEFNEDNKLPADIYLIDEASMADTLLMHVILRAMPDSARVIIVGDVDQLASVGPGKVLKDLIQSGAVPVYRLREIHRQALGSLIIKSSHEINNGKAPQIPSYPSPGSDCLWSERAAPDDAYAHIQELITEYLKEYTPDQIQILSPMRSGRLGVIALNLLMQKLLNPKSQDKSASKVRLGELDAYEGDRVMQTKNDYERDIYNGDVGTIHEINEEDGVVIVCFEDGQIGEWDLDKADSLQLAYAVTVHKSQGSEYPIVIMVVSTSHYTMLARSTIYTGMTRAQRLLHLVGTRKALYIAAQRSDTQARETGLIHRLRNSENL